MEERQEIENKIIEEEIRKQKKKEKNERKKARRRESAFNRVKVSMEIFTYTWKKLAKCGLEGKADFIRLMNKAGVQVQQRLQ